MPDEACSEERNFQQVEEGKKHLPMKRKTAPEGAVLFTAVT